MDQPERFLVQLGFSLVFAAIGAGYWAIRRARLKARLRAIDEGRICVACNDSATRVQDGWVSCQRCGHRSELASLERAAPTSSEVRGFVGQDDP